MSSPIFDSTFATGRFMYEEPMTTDPTTSPSPEPQDVREALNEALRFLDKIDHWVSAKYATLAARKICDVLEKLPALAQSHAEPVAWRYRELLREARPYVASAKGDDTETHNFVDGLLRDIDAALAQSDAGSASSAGLIEAAEWHEEQAQLYEEANSDPRLVRWHMNCSRVLRYRAADRSVHVAELIPDCPTDGVAARQGNGG